MWVFLALYMAGAFIVFCWHICHVVIEANDALDGYGKEFRRISAKYAVKHLKSAIAAPLWPFTLLALIVEVTKAAAELPEGE